MKNQSSELESSQILTDKWINYDFRADLTRPKDRTKEDFLEYCDNLGNKMLSFTIGQMTMADSYEVKNGWFKKHTVFKGTLNKSITVQTLFDKDDYTIILRFNEVTEELLKETEKGHYYRHKAENETREYKFSPVQFQKSTSIMHAIEFSLITMFGLKQLDLWEKEGRMVIQFIYDENNNPMILETDGIAYFTYPFEKRVELYLKHPKIEKELFKNWDFKDFVEWVLSKKDKSDYDKKFCLSIENLVKKYGVFDE